MAIKGKRKSRGGQRRPAAAPRPTYVPQRRRRAWYRTTEGLMVLSILGAVAIGLVIWGVSSMQANARELENKQEALESYTGAVRGIISELAAPVSAMTGAPAGIDDAGVKDLDEDAEAWKTQLEAVQTQIFSLPTAPGAQGVTGVLEQAVTLYISAADTYALVPRIEGKVAESVLVRAAAQRDSANTVLESALTVLDSARSQAELEPAGLTTPASLATQPQPTAIPTPQITVPTDGETDGGKKDGGGKKGGGKGKDGGDGKGG